MLGWILTRLDRIREARWFGGVMTTTWCLVLDGSGSSSMDRVGEGLTNRNDLEGACCRQSLDVDD